MRIGLSWRDGTKEYRYAGMDGAHAEGERETVGIEGGELVYRRRFKDGDSGVAVVGYCAEPGAPSEPLYGGRPGSQSAIPLTVTVWAAREVVATAEEVKELDGIEVEAERRWVDGANGVRYANAAEDGNGSGDGEGDRQAEPERPGQDTGQGDGLGGFSDTFAAMAAEYEADSGNDDGSAASEAMSDFLRQRCSGGFGLGR